MSFLRTCFSFSGRMNRSEYATVYFGSIFALVAGFVVAIGLFHAFDDGDSSTIAMISLFGFIGACKWATLAGLAKRLHDVGASGGICLVAFIPAVGVLLCLVMLFVPGTKSANRYGAPTHFFKPHMSYAGT
jgi:uncharacterized membrane protein YhaH (DUF805 family)